MWLRANKDGLNPKHSIYWVEDEKAAQKEIDEGVSTRCIDPSGVAFGEASPEAINKQLKAEANRKKASIKKIIKK